MASLSARVGDEPSDSTTRGWVFSAKNGARSTSVNGRSTSRDVTTLGPRDPDPDTAPAPDPTRRQPSVVALIAVSAAQR